MWQDDFFVETTNCITRSEIRGLPREIHEVNISRGSEIRSPKFQKRKLMRILQNVKYSHCQSRKESVNFFSRMPRPYRMSVRSGGLEKLSNRRLQVFRHCQPPFANLT